jgi:GAF domain-containing protein
MVTAIDLFDTLRRVADPAISRDAAYGLCAAAIPNRLFTAMQFHEATMEVERLFSTSPDIYPVSGRKPKHDTAWGQKVLVERQVNIGSGTEDIVWAFADNDTILSLGLTEVMNIPVVRGRRVLGTINFLRDTPPFSEEEVAIAQILAASLALRGK